MMLCYNKDMNKKSNHYEEFANSVIKKIYPYLITDLKNYYNDSFDKKTILEIGTGPGHIIEELLKENFSKVIGIDISLDMLLRAKKRNYNNSNLFLINAKAEKIPLFDSSIDIVISRGSVFFWKDLDAAFKEIYRILKPNGFLLIGGGYGISTPESIISDIHEYFKNSVTKNDKPKLNIDKAVAIMQSIGGKSDIIAKPKQGFWIAWRK